MSERPHDATQSDEESLAAEPSEAEPSEAEPSEDGPDGGGPDEGGEAEPADAEAGAQAADAGAAEPVVDGRAEAGDEERAGASEPVEDEPQAASEPDDEPAPPRVVRRLGTGLMGAVDLMMQPTEATQQAYARKRLLHMRPRDTARFRRHFESLSRLDHPNLVHYARFDAQGDVPEFTQEYIEGRDLLTHLVEAPTAEERETLRGRLLDAQEVISEVDEISRTDLSYSRAGDRPPGAPDEPSEVEAAAGAASEAEPSGEPPGAQESGAGELSEADAAASPPSIETTIELIDEATTDELLDAEISATEVVAEIAEASEVEDEFAEVSLDLILLRLERLLPQMVAALEHLHRFRHAHGDLKPSNVLIGRDGRLSLTDYGLLSALEAVPEAEPEPSAGPDAASEAGADGVGQADGGQEPGERAELPGPPADAEVVRTMAYRAPESASLSQVEPPGDLFSLGCILFEAISGQRPFNPHHSRPGERIEPRSLLDCEPRTPATWVDLVHGLLDDEPSRRPDFAEIRRVAESSESHAVGIPPTAVPEQEFFFGRSTLVEAIIDESKRCAKQRRLSVCMLSGPTGVGKTAVSRAVAYLASQRGWLVLRGKSYNRESLIYQGWDDIAAELAEICDRLPEETRERLAACRRQAAALFPDLAPDGAEPAADLHRLDAIASLRTLLRRISVERPLLIVLDDLHWTSWDSAELLLDVITETEGLRCMVLATWQPDAPRAEDHPLIEHLDAAPAPVLWFDVGGFSKDEAREYVVSAGSHLPLRQQRRVLQDGEFNPLLLEELIYDETGVALAAAESTPSAPSSAELADARLTDVVRSRLEELSRRESFVLEVLSVASLPLPESIITVIVDDEFGGSQSYQNQGAARSIVSRLIDLRLLRVVETHHWDRAFTLAHNLYRRLILDELREQRYAHLCSRIADALRLCWPEAEELRFEYLLRSGRARDAIDAAVRAAEICERRFAYHRAAKLWRWLAGRGENLGLGPDVDPRVELGRMEFLAGRHAEAAGLFAERAEATTGFEHARLRWLESEAHLRAAEHRRAMLALDDALSFYGQRFFSKGLASTLTEFKNRALSATRRLFSDVEQARVDGADAHTQLLGDLYGQALGIDDILDTTKSGRFRAKLSMLAERSADCRLMGMDRAFLAREDVREDPNHRSRRIHRLYQDADRLFERAGDRRGRAMVALAEAVYLADTGDVAAAEESLAHAERFLRRAPRDGMTRRYLIQWMRGRLAAVRASYDEAERHAAQLLHYYRGDELARFRGYQILVPIDLLRGRTTQAEYRLDACRTILSETPVNLASLWVAVQTSQLNLAQGRPDVSVGQLDVLSDRLHDSKLIRQPYIDLPLHLTMGQALAALADREQALGGSRIKEAMDRLKWTVRHLRGALAHSTPPVRAAIHRLAARHELLREHPKRALREVDHAASALGDYPDPVAITKNLEARGVVLGKLESTEGRTFVERARAVYDYYVVRSPLILEGWPIGTGFSALHADEE